MATPTTSYGIEVSGLTIDEVERLENFVRHLDREFRESGMAPRTIAIRVSKPRDRREQPVQGPEHQKVQSVEEMLKAVQAQINPNRHANTSGGGGSVESGGYIRLGRKIGDEPNEV